MLQWWKSHEKSPCWRLLNRLRTDLSGRVSSFTKHWTRHRHFHVLSATELVKHKTSRETEHFTTWPRRHHGAVGDDCTTCRSCNWYIHCGLVSAVSLTSPATVIGQHMWKAWSFAFIHYKQPRVKLFINGRKVLKKNSQNEHIHSFIIDTIIQC